MSRNLIALAISVQMPLSEVETWDDQTIATAWDLLDQAQMKEAANG